MFKFSLQAGHNKPSLIQNIAPQIRFLNQFSIMPHNSPQWDYYSITTLIETNSSHQKNWMVGILVFLFGARPNFQVLKMLVSGSVTHLNDFAHIPSEDTPNFPKPHKERNSFIHSW